MLGGISSWDHGFNPQPDQTKDLEKLVLGASQLGTQHLGVEAKIGWSRVRMMCPGRVTLLHVDCNPVDYHL